MLVKNSLASYLIRQDWLWKMWEQKMINNKPLIRAVTKSETEEYQMIRTTFLEKRKWSFLRKV